MVFKVILKSSVWSRGGMGANSGEKECSRIRILAHAPILVTQWIYLQELFKTVGP